MVVDNEVFGTLTFDYTWSKNELISFRGKEVSIAFLVAGDEDGDFEEGQYEAYKMLINKWSVLQDSILEAILNYYKNKRRELGYEIEPTERYPVITTTDQLLHHIMLVGIKIPYAKIYGGRSIGLSFDCTWDDENGLGIRLNNENVIEVGFQDIAI